jgi:transcription elongation factor GreA
MNKKREFYLTEDGVKKLQDELAELTDKGRKEIARALKEAKELGDLSENAGWDDAKERQVFIEGRIAEIDSILKQAKIIKKTTGGVVDIGSTVHVELESGKQEFRIVGSTEADPSKGLISNESPIGQALLGCKPGDEVEIEVPAGTITYKVIKIK